MKKILFISKYISTNLNGFESRLATLIRFFSKNNYVVEAITSSGSLRKNKFKNRYNCKKINNVNYNFIKQNNNYSQYSIKRIVSWISFEYFLFKFDLNKIKFKPDIIYVSSLSLLTILNGIYLKKKYKAKLVFEMRDLWPFYLYSTGKFSKFNLIIIILGIIEKIGIYKSDLIIGLSPRINKYLKFRGFNKKKNFSSTFPVNKSLFKKKKINIKVNKKKFNLCYAGNFGYDNHLDDLLNVISKLSSHEFFFHFFGKGSQKNFLIKKYSHFKNIKFYKHIEYSKLHSALIKMDSMILSFGFRNNYPIFGHELNKLNNYLMTNKPIVVFGSSKNLSINRGKFLFIEKNDTKLFESKLKNLKKKYIYWHKISKINKEKFLKRNDAKKIFKETLNYLESL